MAPDIQTSLPEEVEKNKDNLDLKPDLEYVLAHLDRYRAILSLLMGNEIPEENKERLAGVKTENVKDDATLQLPPTIALQILAHLPPEILKISSLHTIDYKFQDRVPIPDFDENGHFKGCTKTTWGLSFPQKMNAMGQTIEFHPTRILIGNSHQGVIYPTFIPKTVCDKKEAVRIYQIHTLLHEFFHTIAEQFRKEEDAQRLLMRLKTCETITFSDWRKEFIRSMVEEEPQFTSRYSQTYANQITKDADTESIGAEEQLCESFAAFILRRAPNNQGYDDFTTTDFGNKHPEIQLAKGYGSIRHELMDQFFGARFEILPKEKPAGKEG